MIRSHINGLSPCQSNDKVQQDDDNAGNKVRLKWEGSEEIICEEDPDPTTIMMVEQVTQIDTDERQQQVNSRRSRWVEVTLAKDEDAGNNNSEHLQQEASASGDGQKFRRYHKKHRHHHRSHCSRYSGGTISEKSSVSEFQQHQHQRGEAISTMIPLTVMAQGVVAKAATPSASTSNLLPSAASFAETGSIGAASCLTIVATGDERKNWRRLAKESAVFGLVCGCWPLTIPAAYFAFRRDPNERYKLSFLLSVIGVLITTIVLVSIAITVGRQSQAKAAAS